MENGEHGHGQWGEESSTVDCMLLFCSCRWKRKMPEQISCTTKDCFSQKKNMLACCYILWYCH